MLMRKSIFALATIFALGSISLAASAYAARNGGGHSGGGHFSGGHFSGVRPGGGHFSGVRPGGGHFSGVRPGSGQFTAGTRAHASAAGGHHRHFWHGRWWAYGIGPCWVWSDLYSEYVWACD